MARTTTRVRPPHRPETNDQGMSDTNHIAMASPQDVDHGVTPSRSPSLSGFDERDHDSDLEVNFKSDMMTRTSNLVKAFKNVPANATATVSSTVNMDNLGYNPDQPLYLEGVPSDVETDYYAEPGVANGIPGFERDYYEAYFTYNDIDGTFPLYDGPSYGSALESPTYTSHGRRVSRCAILLHQQVQSYS